MADERYKPCHVVLCRVSQSLGDDYFMFELRDDDRRLLRVEMTGQQLAQALTARVTEAKYEEFTIGQRRGGTRD